MRANDINPPYTTQPHTQIHFQISHSRTIEERGKPTTKPLETCPSKPSKKVSVYYCKTLITKYEASKSCPYNVTFHLAYYPGGNEDAQ